MQGLLGGGTGPIARPIFRAFPAAGLIAEGHAGGEAFQFEGQLREPADLRERHLTPTRIGGQFEPAFRGVNDLMREDKFLDAELLQIRLGGGDGGADHMIQSVLSGVGEAALEGGHPAGPVEFCRQAADGTEGTSGLFGRSAMRTTPLEPQIGGKGGEVGGRFAGLTLPEAGSHIINDFRLAIYD